MSDVRVRFEIPALGHAWHDEVTVTRTPLVDNLITAGRLTLLADLGETVREPAQAAPADLPAGKSWFGPETAPAEPAPAG